MVFNIMTLYNAYDLGIVRALSAIWLLFIPIYYPNGDAENRARQQPRNMDKITLLHPLECHLHHHYNRGHIFHRYNKCHLDLTLEEV